MDAMHARLSGADDGYAMRTTRKLLILPFPRGLATWYEEDRAQEESAPQSGHCGEPAVRTRHAALTTFPGFWESHT